MLKPRIITKRISYSELSCDDALVVPANQQLNLHSVALVNGDATGTHEISLGISKKFRMFSLLAGVATKVTFPVTMFADASAYLIETDEPIDMVAFDAVASTTTTFSVQCYNGTSLVTIPTLSFSNAAGKGALLTAVNHQVAPGTLAANISFDPTKYYLYIVPLVLGTSLTLNSVKACKVLSSRLVSANQALTLDFAPDQALFAQGEALVPLFGIASNLNLMEICYRINP
jgi:hypothetical protein